MKLYYHKTTGGAEYLCSSPVEGTDEGSFNSEYIVRIDGDIRIWDRTSKQYLDHADLTIKRI
jgi:hypothetical protein